MTKREKRVYCRAWYRRHKAAKNIRRELFGAYFDLSWYRPLHRKAS